MLVLVETADLQNSFGSGEGDLAHSQDFQSRPCPSPTWGALGAWQQESRLEEMAMLDFPPSREIHCSPGRLPTGKGKVRNALEVQKGITASNPCI